MPSSKVSPHERSTEQYEKDKQSPYERLMYSLHNDPKWTEEVTLGRRIGLYKIRGEIGSGNFSQVKMAVHQLIKERVAIKILDKSCMDETVKRMVSREIECMECAHHPNIIRLYEVVETFSKLYLVMEFAGGGELYNKITTHGKLEEIQAKLLFAQITSAVSFMHDKNLVHRDIKAENVFFYSPNRVKLGDLGFSVCLTKGRDQLLTTYCGSPPYAAPELFRDEHYIGGPVDAWALGVLLYFMICGTMPFKGPSLATLKLNIIEGIYPVPKHVSNECMRVLENVLVLNPRDRWSTKKILGCDWLIGQVDTTNNTSNENKSYTLLPTIPPHRVTLQNAPLSEVEKTARERLQILGITNDLLASQSVLGSRSHVIGCYRIVIHKVQKQLSCFLEIDGLNDSANSSNRKSSIKSKKFSLLKLTREEGQRQSWFSLCWRKMQNSVSDVRSLSDIKFGSETDDKSHPSSAAPTEDNVKSNSNGCAIL